MANVAYEQALEVVRTLSPEDQRRLFRELEAERQQQTRRVNGDEAHHRERETRWFTDERNRAKYGGQWVALDGERLVSHGTDLRQVYAEADAAGVKHPLVGFLEAEDELPFGG